MKVLNFSKVNHKNLVLNPLLSLSPLIVIIVGIFAIYGRANAAILGELKISGTLDVESLGEFQLAPNSGCTTFHNKLSIRFDPNNIFDPTSTSVFFDFCLITIA